MFMLLLEILCYECVLYSDCFQIRLKKTYASPELYEMSVNMSEPVSHLTSLQ